jgi:hypothetical protein
MFSSTASKADRPGRISIKPIERARDFVGVASAAMLYSNEHRG